MAAVRKAAAYFFLIVERKSKTIKVIGVDGFNQSITGEVAMTVTCAASDCHHVPLVIETKRNPKKTIDGLRFVDKV